MEAIDFASAPFCVDNLDDKMALLQNLGLFAEMSEEGVSSPCDAEVVCDDQQRRDIGKIKVRPRDLGKQISDENHEVDIDLQASGKGEG